MQLRARRLVTPVTRRWSKDRWNPSWRRGLTGREKETHKLPNKTGEYCAGISRRRLVKALVSEATRQRLSRGRCSWAGCASCSIPAERQKCVNVSGMKDECPAVVLISRPHRGCPGIPPRFSAHYLSLVSTVIPPAWILQVLVNVEGRSSAARPR